MGERTGSTEKRADLTPSLVVRLRRGESAAGAFLDQLYRARMIRFCRGYLGSAEEVEDAVQDIFYKVLASPTVPDDFRAWLYRIARNHCLDLRKRKGRRRDDASLPAESRLVAALTGNLTRLVKGENRARLRRLVATLPPAQREVLHLRYADQLSRAEIAKVLGISESLVKSRLFEGLEKLRAHDSLRG